MIAHVHSSTIRPRRRPAVPAFEVMPPQLSMQMAILVLATVPILVVYPFLQKHFAKGVMIGAVKG